jgi:type IX secretion system PorP/SprF family membrane protein
MRGFLLMVLLFLMQALHGQALARYNLYPYTSDFANPAATGLTDCLVLNATDMHQWVGIKDAPNIQSFSVQIGIPALKTKRQGLGLNLVRDVNGPSKSTGGELLYSFQVLVGRNRSTWLSLGLSGNFEQRRLDESGFSQVFDPRITGGFVQEPAFNASSGIYLYTGKYYAGMAVYNLLPVNNTLGTGYGGDRYSLSVQGGYLFAGLPFPARIQSSIQGSLGKEASQFDLNNRILFDNQLWTGITLRKYTGRFMSAGQNVLVFIGYNWNKWSFCYNYNFDLNGTRFHHFGTHQLSLAYSVCHNHDTCPAYR